VLILTDADDHLFIFSSFWNSRYRLGQSNGLKFGNQIIELDVHAQAVVASA
jgi:hypothetical protein